MDAEPSRLRELLDALHAELARHPLPDERDRELLRGLREDIARLDPTTPTATPSADAAPTEPGTGPHSLRTRLQEMVVRLEGTHPQLAAAIEQTTVALSNMGL